MRWPDIDSSNGRGARIFRARRSEHAGAGTAADIIKLAMLEVDAAIRSRRLASRMVLQVHDELMFDVPLAEVEEMSNLVRECMESAVTLRVPLKVDIGSGGNWFDAH